MRATACARGGRLATLALTVTTLGACASHGGGEAASNDESGLPATSLGEGSGDASGAGFASSPGTQTDGRAPRGERCDDAGRCTCFSVASIGHPGHTGFQGGGGADNTDAFIDWLNQESSTNVDLYTQKPTLSAAFLAQYDVLVVQWLVDQVNGENGSGYWTFSPNELAAVKAWVLAGGGIITLSGYDVSAQEVAPVNALLQAVSGLSYGTDDVLTNAGDYCVGESEALRGWVQSTPIGQHLEAVGAFHGRPVVGKADTVDCADTQWTYAAHEDVGAGHVFAFTDEWVTYSSQWFGVDAGASCPTSAATAYQVPQFWFNAIRYASQATQCTFTLDAPDLH